MVEEVRAEMVSYTVFKLMTEGGKHEDKDKVFHGQDR